MNSSPIKKERVILVGCAVKSSSKNLTSELKSLSVQESLDELAFLAGSAGGEVVGRLSQERERIDSAYFIGRGKLQQLQERQEMLQAQVIIFDENLSPAQQRNLEKVLMRRVIDRTQLILDIFARRARTREGRLQVELAQLNYLLPRLAGKGIEFSRLGGGIGTRGPGETKLETDQRKIRNRIHTIKGNLERVRAHRHLHRSHRSSIPVPVISLVGYTNAGKSTLFNTITSAGTFASNQLFATLDPLLRRLQLPSGREVILSDTVGFIHKLPHTLVTAFRATLEEINDADLLLHVIDISNPHFEQQRQAVYKVLEEIEVTGKTVIEVNNKIDLLPDCSSLQEQPTSAFISAITGTGIPELLEKIDSLLSSDPLAQAHFVFSQKEGAEISRLCRHSRLIHRSYESNLVMLEVEAPRSILNQFQAWEKKALPADMP